MESFFVAAFAFFIFGLAAMTTLRNVVGQSSLDELLQHRDKINFTVQNIIDN